MRTPEQVAALDEAIARGQTGNADGLNRHPCCAVMHITGSVCRAHALGLTVAGELDPEMITRAEEWLGEQDRTVALAALAMASDGLRVVALIPGSKGATYTCPDCANDRDAEGKPIKGSAKCNGYRRQPDAKTKDPGEKCGRPGCHGYLGATTDGPEVFRMFHEHPDALIGHRPLPDVIVLDPDQHADEHGVVEKDGPAWLASMADIGLALPDTMTSATASGEGRHYFLTVPHGLVIDAAWMDRHGVNVKTGSNGLVVVPPQPGSKRAWLSYGSIAPAPAWVLGAIEKRPRDATTSTRSAPDPGNLFRPSTGGDSAYNRETTLRYWLIDERPDNEKWTVVSGDGESNGDLWLRPGGGTSSTHSAKVLVGDDGVPRLAIHSDNSPIPKHWTDDNGTERKAYSPTDLKNHFEGTTQ